MNEKESRRLSIMAGLSAALACVRAYTGTGASAEYLVLAADHITRAMEELVAIADALLQETETQADRRVLQFKQAHQNHPRSADAGPATRIHPSEHG